MIVLLWIQAFDRWTTRTIHPRIQNIGSSNITSFIVIKTFTGSKMYVQYTLTSVSQTELQK